MQYLKINKIQTENGTMDYKGLNIDKFVQGTHVYPQDFSYCLVGTSEQITGNFEDVILLTEAEYNTEKSLVVYDIQKTPEQNEIEALKLMVADLALNAGGGL